MGKQPSKKKITRQIHPNNGRFRDSNEYTSLLLRLSLYSDIEDQHKKHKQKVAKNNCGIKQASD
jgi:hypothetical protein